MESQVIKHGWINGQEHSAHVMSDGNRHIGSILKAGDNGFAQHYSQTFESFDEAVKNIHETWAQLEKAAQN
jgi:hypothetical protein